MTLRRWLALVPIPIAGVALAYWAFSAGLINNTTPSLPLGLYVRDERPVSAARRDDIIAFCAPKKAVEFQALVGNTISSSAYCKKSPVYLKKVAAIPGDIVSFTPRGISVNGDPPIYGTMPLRFILADGHKFYLPKYPFGKSVVPPGKVWAYSHQWFGLDSRYYGPVTPLTRMRPFLVGPDEILPTPPPALAEMQKKS